MKRILAFVIVLSVLLSVCSISAAAAPLYSVEADTKAFTPFAFNALNAAAVATDTGSTLINGDSSYWSTWSSYLAGYLSCAGYSVAESVYRAMNSLNSSVASLSSIDFSSDAIRADVSSILSDMGAITTAIQTVITAIETNTTAVGEVETAVGNVNTSVGDVEDAVSALEDALADYMTLPAGNFILSTSGFSVESSTPLDVTDITRRGLIGLSAHLRSLSGSGFLNVNGQQSTTTENQTLSYILRYGFLGLRSLIAGSESDNAYSLTLWDNNNTSTSSTATGLGPMLNSQLSSVGKNLAKLTFMFAADDDIELKSDSQPAVDAVTSEVFEGDGKVKLDGAKVSSLTGISNDVLGYFDNGGELSDVDTVMNDSSTWKWFTSETAADLDTTASTYSVRSAPASDAHAEWYSSFYRNVLGREYKGE